MGLNAVYLAFEVKNPAAAVAGIRELGIQGISVTIPLKTRVIPFLDGLDGAARKIGAVNTISNRDGKLIGYNTDWQGGVEALEARVSLKGKRVILLGAGGAARAIAFGLKEKGCEVTIFNRSPEKAAELAQELGFSHGPLLFGEKMDAEVLINATVVGMPPHEAESPCPREFLVEGMTVMDIVYRPLKTKLLQEAEDRGCRTINGLEMLARQGAAQIEIWTARKPDIERIREDLYEALAQ
jgi:shikimate dehydrogenase